MRKQRKRKSDEREANDAFGREMNDGNKKNSFEKLETKGRTTMVNDDGRNLAKLKKAIVNRIRVRRMCLSRSNEG